jgi:hypothetical protein
LVVQNVPPTNGEQVKDGLPVVLVVPLLMEALPAELADPGLVPVVDPHVGVQRRAP